MANDETKPDSDFGTQLQQLNFIVKALEGLTEEERIRVVASVTVFFSIEEEVARRTTKGLR